MCKFNVMCQSKDGLCNCSEQKPVIPQVVRPSLPAGPTEAVLLYHLYAIINQQNEVIRTLSEQTSTALKKVETLTKTLESANLGEGYNIVVAKEEVTTSEHILKILSGNKTDHHYSMRVVSELPQPAYKERAFSLMLEIVNQNGEKANFPIPVSFKILLFTTESPPKLLKVNTAGDKIMRGSVEVERNGVIFFRKIVVKEVTSHFRKGCFFLAVVPKNSTDIKPLVIDNFVIKARKSLASEPTKRIKCEETVESSQVVNTL
jgi:hypothetical protein